MTAQEKFLQAYDLAEFGIKSRLKDLHGSGSVYAVVRGCRRGTYTKNDVVKEMHNQLLEIAQDVRDEALEMYNLIESI